MGIGIASGEPLEGTAPQLGIGCLAYGKQHLGDVMQEVLGLVEQTVAQTSAYQDAQEAVDEHGVELLVAQLLLAEQAMHEQIHAHQAHTPAERIPPHGQRTQLKGRGGGVPMDEEFGHTLNLKCIMSPS